MNKEELAISIAQKAGLKKTQALAALNATIATIQETLQKGERVILVGFGSFDVAYRATRTGVQPMTKEKIEIADKVSIKFKTGKELETAVNNKPLKDKLSKKKK